MSPRRRGHLPGLTDEFLAYDAGSAARQQRRPKPSMPVYVAAQRECGGIRVCRREGRKRLIDQFTDLVRNQIVQQPSLCLVMPEKGGVADMRPGRYFSDRDVIEGLLLQ